MNGILGRPYRVFYTAKNIQSGLSGIVANVLRPDGSIVGPFNLLELANTNFSGIYYFDLLTTQLMPEGEYLVTVKEGSYKSPVKISFNLPSANDIQVDTQKIVGTIKQEAKLVGKINANRVIGTVKGERRITGVVTASSIKATVKNNSLTGNITSNKIVGKIIC